MSLLPKFILAALISVSLITASNADNHIAAIPAGLYENDPAHTSVHFTISHLGFSRFVGRFNFTQATLTIDPNNLPKTTLSAIIDIASLDANSQHLENTVARKNFFYTEWYPTATFNSTFLHPTSDTTAILFGNLSLKGVTHPIQMDVELIGNGPHPFSQRYTIGFQGSTTIQRSQWGVSGLLPAIGDDVTLNIAAEFVHQP